AWRILVVASAAVQRDLAAALDLTPESRAGTVVAMLQSNARRAPGYWLQLTLSMGIATLGLVLGSTAVVIGAMLVSPLMGPIIELGMGFAVGSSLLVIRSFIRVFMSVVWVIVSAAMITVLLPFHEVTSEIASRTAPTALDLILAAFCALTAAYTTVRVAADTTAAAAGTAIGIALVPPLCVTGYGVGTGSVAIASGAGLLFTANFSAIVVLAALSFVLLGSNDVDAGPLETDVLSGDSSASERIAEAVAGVEPDVSVIAVPDAEALATLTADQRRATAPVALPAQPDVPMLRQRVSAALGVAWPTAEAGPVVGWTFEMRRTGDPVVRVKHLGKPVGDAGAAMLASRITGMIGSRVTVAAEAIALDTGESWSIWIAGGERARTCGRGGPSPRSPTALC
ncbi:MAG: DUF389 domain-containing protein, partial [Gemmatimonadaceae bacterium]|nr:DUF389 domain-containing protein [Gemmatimonadaceae bacterium]